MHLHLRASKNPKHQQPYHCLDKWKCCTHWQKWVVLLLCLTWARWPRFPHKGQWVPKKKINRLALLTSFPRTWKLMPPMREAVPAKHRSMTSWCRPTASKIWAPCNDNYNHCDTAMVKRNKYDVAANKQKQEPDVTHKPDGKDEATTALWFQSQYTEMVILNRRNKNQHQAVKQYLCYTNTYVVACVQYAAMPWYNNDWTKILIQMHNEIRRNNICTLVTRQANYDIVRQWNIHEKKRKREFIQS